MGVFSELKRRNVFRVGVAYAIAAWVILQVIDVVAPILELPAWAPRLILVILAAGLVPALIFAWAYELTPEGLKREREVDRSQSITHRTGRKLDFIIIGVLAVGIAFLLVERTWTGAPPEDTAAAGTADKSIAVLPFVNMSSDPEQEFFSDGITEEILNSLASVSELKVAGRTSSFAFKGRNDDLRQIGETLGVAHILEGSVRKSGDKVRITAQLIRTDNGFHLWSETYDRDLTDIFAIQDEIAGEILGSLTAQLVEGAPEPAETERTDPQAYELYLQAKQQIYMRNTAAIESAVDLLDRAIAIDPRYAPAQAQRGIATLLLSENTYGTMAEEDARRTALRFVERAIELDPLNAEAWASLGLYHTNRPGGTAKGIEALEKALEINPNLIDARNWLQINLQASGDIRGSLEVVADLAKRDPLYKPGLGNAVGTLTFFGRQEEASAVLDRYRRFDPDDPVLLQAEALYEVSAGNMAEAYRLAARARALAPADATVGYAYFVTLVVNQMVDDLAEEGRLGFDVDALDWLGRREEALASAREGAQAGYPSNLFHLLNRAGRSREVVDYVDERWPDLDAFSADVPQGPLGYPEMLEIAVAYQRTGGTDDYRKALDKLDGVMTRLEEAGVDHFVFDLNMADYLALQGETDAAFERLRAAIDRGLSMWPDLAFALSAMGGLEDDPRLLELDERLAGNVSRQRAILGLQPVMARNGAWRPE